VNTKRVIAIASATLVAGLVIGQMSGAFAARSAEAPLQNRGAESAACNGSGVKFGPTMRDAGGRLLDIVADLTGLSTEEVAEQRAEGESIADIAASKEVEADAVVDAALDARKAALDELVADGTITQEQADEMLERMSTRLSDRITSTETGNNGCGAGGPGVGGGGGNGDGGRGKGGGRGGGGGSCGSCPNGQ
jgi:hypothetical protein